MTRKTYTTLLMVMLGSLLSSSAVAQSSFPDTPLQTSANKPAANIMFILDDSGSMEFDYMPDGMSSSDFYRKNWNINPLAYNPNKTYEPWRNHDGTKMTGGMSYTSAWSDLSRATSARNLWNDYIVFYSPKSATLARGNTTPSNYYEYAIYVDRGTQYYTRCEYRNSSSGWSNNCVSGNSARPNTSRTWAQELENYATWYSYHRTRMKVAKAGVTEAFSQLNGGVRVGYDSIWNRSQMNIPVGTDNGLFRDGNKQTWFSRILNADGSGGTPLHGSLARAGAYFQQTGSGGPWGPESGSSQYSCRQNFTILTSDGYWNNENGYSSSSTQVGNADGTDGVTITSARGETYKYTPRRPYMDNFPDTLADVSMHYWKTDLRTDLSNNVPASADNPAFWQHMVTFGISIGLSGSLNPQTDLQSMTNGSKTWPDPWRTSSSNTRSWSNESNRRIDDLWHASVNGRGTFSVASDPEQFSKGLKSALGNIQKTLASGSNVSTSSTSLQTDTRIFHATYYSGIWTGELAAYDISSAGVSQDPSWTASSNISFTNRKAFTYDTQGRTFPTSAQTTELATGFGVDGVTGTQIADYLKGSKTNEQLNNGPFRNRDSLMGDIVNSSPIYAVDTDTLFIGTNGGSLHSVNASTGAENFIYFPKGINYRNLGTVADPEYAHRYFVDGQIAVSNFKQTPAKNYLIAALGRGGKGVFGLDVTAPSSFTATKVLWDTTGGTDNDMGFVLGEIIIAKTNSNQTVALVPNGIDSTSGKAVLYVIDLATGTVIRKIDTGVAGTNGLSSPRGWDEDRDGKLDYVYAGDLRGNLWKFDFTSTSASGWGVALSGQPLFKAVVGGVEQPITGGLALGVEAFGDSKWILFGTGRYIQQGDITNTSQQTLYGVIDTGVVTSRANLQERTIKVIGGGANALRSFETFKPLPSGKKGWYIDLGRPYAGERVIERGFLSGRMFVFPSVVPLSGNPCESAGKGFINAIDAFTGTSVSSNGANHPYFDVGSDGNKNNDWLTDPTHTGPGDGKLPVGSIETDIGMVTKPVLVGDQIVYGGSSGGKETEKVNLPPGSAKRLSWREVFN